MSRRGSSIPYILSLCHYDEDFQTDVFSSAFIIVLEHHYNIYHLICQCRNGKNIEICIARRCIMETDSV